MLALATNEGVSRWVARPRPEIANPVVDRDANSGSFPCGPATLSMTVYGCLALVLARRQPRSGVKLLIGVAAGVLILLVGFSQLYLCTNYMTDVVGGWCAGLTWVMVFLYAEQCLVPLRHEDTRFSRFSTVPAGPRHVPSPPPPPPPQPPPSSVAPRSIRADGSVGPPSRFTPKEP